MIWASLCSALLLMRVMVALVLSRWESIVRCGSKVLSVVLCSVVSLFVLFLSDFRMVFALLIR